eukprot:9162191-Pyramimonas_sp.AAC.1
MASFACCWLVRASTSSRTCPLRHSSGLSSRRWRVLGLRATACTSTPSSTRASSAARPSRARGLL